MSCKITSFNGQVYIEGTQETLTIILNTVLPCKQVVLSMKNSLTGNQETDHKIAIMMKQCFQKTFSNHSAFHLNHEVLASDDIWKIEFYDGSGCLVETLYNDWTIANEFICL